MTEITRDDVEWAVVRRLQLMLEEPPHQKYNVTQTYAIFTVILCWVMQRIRVDPRMAKTRNDLLAADLMRKLSAQRITEEPWSIRLTARNAHAESNLIRVPAAFNFND